MIVRVSLYPSLFYQKCSLIWPMFIGQIGKIFTPELNKQRPLGLKVQYCFASKVIRCDSQTSEPRLSWAMSYPWKPALKGQILPLGAGSQGPDSTLDEGSIYKV